MILQIYDYCTFPGLQLILEKKSNKMAFSRILEHASLYTYRRKFLYL